MANEQSTIKGIVWSEMFSFPQIFKSFKIATQPHALALALVGLVLLFAGGWVMDGIWSVSDSGTVGQGEILGHFSTAPALFDARMEQWRQGRPAAAAALLAKTKNDRRELSNWRGLVGRRSPYFWQAFERLRSDYVTAKESGEAFAPVQAAQILAEAEKNDDDWDDLLGQAQEAHEYEIDKVLVLLDDVEDSADDLIEKDPGLKNADKDKEHDNIDKARDDLDLALLDARAAITLRRLQFAQACQAIEGAGIFESFITFERDCLYNAIMAVRYLNFTGGLGAYQQTVAGRSVKPASLAVVSGLPAPATVAPQNDQPGMLYYMLLACEGVRWLILQHWVFAAIILLWALTLWSLLGGAIYRMAAIRFSRDEKISLFQALRFSRGKFFSFFSAPLVPVVVILSLGLLLAAGGVVGSIPFIGPLLMGLLFGIAILVGIAIAFMALGLAGGGAMLYPTIAAEGSDCFDAISRSFTYVFTKPFRAVFYGVVASIYGMVTYLFVRLFAYLALSAVHFFVKWGVFTGGSSLGAGADQLDVLWAKPSFWNLHQFNFSAMGAWESICAILVSVWVCILAGLVGAYAITFFVSASTTIYFILRRRVDATDLDDVFVEEVEEVEETKETEQAEDVQEETVQAEEPAERTSTETESATEESAEEQADENQ